MPANPITNRFTLSYKYKGRPIYHEISFHGIKPDSCVLGGLATKLSMTQYDASAWLRLLFNRYEADANYMAADIFTTYTSCSDAGLNSEMMSC